MSMYLENRIKELEEEKKELLRYCLKRRAGLLKAVHKLGAVEFRFMCEGKADAFKDVIRKLEKQINPICQNCEGEGCPFCGEGCIQM